MQRWSGAGLGALSILVIAAAGFEACSQDADQCSNSNSCPPTSSTTGSSTSSSTSGTDDGGPAGGAGGGNGAAGMAGGGHGGA